MAWLVALDAELSGQRFPLNAPCLLGRGPYNHVVLDDMRISRQHSKISPEPGGYVVYDLNSVNGTYVNDVLVRRKKLEPGDVVRIGPYSFGFEASDPDRTQKVARGEFLHEALTVAGMEPPAKIIKSVDASAPSSSAPKIKLDLNQLEDAYRQLRTLYTFMQAIATTLDTAELVEKIARNLIDVFPAARTVAVYLRDAKGAMVPRVQLPAGEQQKVALPAILHEQVVEKGRAVLSSPASTAARRGKPAGGGLSMHAPIFYGDATQGVLHVQGKDEADAPLFGQIDLDLLTGLAAQAAMALQNARMHQASIKQQRLQQDLALAEQIQKSFLPRQLPSVAGLEFVTEYQPAYSVGGDFYDVFWVDRERIGVFIGDVSGKGVSAALLMARVSSDLRVAAMTDADPARALSRVNRATLERRQHDIFITGVYLTFDVRTRELLLANAGHLPSFIRRGGQAGGLERVEGGTGTAIGIFEDAEYNQVRLQLDPGDSLVLCTDGILEATDSHGTQFGFERLEASLANGGSAPGELALRLLTDLRAHVGEAAQADDLTLIVCGVTSGAPAATRPRRPDLPTLTAIPRPT